MPSLTLIASVRSLALDEATTHHCCCDCKQAPVARQLCHHTAYKNLVRTPHRIASRSAHVHDALVPDVAALRPPVRVGLAVALAQREALRLQAPHEAQGVVFDLLGR